MEMWKCHTQTKQVPIPDEDSQVFWEGCRRQRLLIQQCDNCQAFRFPPSPLCPHCLSPLATWQDDPGRGEVVTFCIYYSEIAGPAWGTVLPYTVAVIHLWYSGIKILSNLVCDDLTLVRIGLPVQVMFDRMSEPITPPKFIPYVAKDTFLSSEM
jgi:uncharacterized OB-fold protein